MIDGTGSPPIGPTDIVIENGVITQVSSVGYPGTPIKEHRRPAAGDHEIDAHGMYVLPGLINAHAHIAHPLQGSVGEMLTAEYVYKLWLAHGVTTVRDVGSGNGLGWTVTEKQRSDALQIAAPRIAAYARFPVSPTLPGSIQSPDQARRWVRDIAKYGADGIKFGGAPPALMQAALDEASKLGLESACHHAQLNVARMNVLDSSAMGLTSMEHWYGLPEALFDDRARSRTIPRGYNYNERAGHRFGEAGRLWAAGGRARQRALGTP